MLFIEKRPEPEALTKAKREGLKSYSEMRSDTKNSIKESLIHEQGHLCAYCMQRIDLESSTIEHYIPQNPLNAENDSNSSIDYYNMLAVCGGNTDRAVGSSELTCDKHRGNIPLTVDPREQSSIAKICYKGDGTIYSPDEEINRDLDQTLNLNCEATLFKQNRKSVLTAVQQEIFKKSAPNKITKRQLENILDKFIIKSKGQYQPFVGIAIWYLRKKLSRFNG